MLVFEILKITIIFDALNPDLTQRMNKQIPKTVSGYVSKLNISYKGI